MESTKIEIGSSLGLTGFKEIDESPPDYATLQKFRLVYVGGDPMIPVYCGISTVWAAQVEENEPVYAIFDAGTNRLVILEKAQGNNWKEVTLNEVKNLYGLIWRMSCNISHVKHELRELAKM